MADQRHGSVQAKTEEELGKECGRTEQGQGGWRTAGHQQIDDGRKAERYGHLPEGTGDGVVAPDGSEALPPLLPLAAEQDADAKSNDAHYALSKAHIDERAAQSALRTGSEQEKYTAMEHETLGQQEQEQGKNGRKGAGIMDEPTDIGTFSRLDGLGAADVSVVFPQHRYMVERKEQEHTRSQSATFCPGTGNVAVDDLQCTDKDDEHAVGKHHGRLGTNDFRTVPQSLLMRMQHALIIHPCRQFVPCREQGKEEQVQEKPEALPAAEAGKYARKTHHHGRDGQFQALELAAEMP